MAAHDCQQQASLPRISAEDFQQLVRGDLITYLLAPEQQPINPLRQWHGRVVLHDPAGWVKVTLLDEGFVGETETVRCTEILKVEKLG